MAFNQPHPSEYRLPSDELIRVHHERPSWWDVAIDWGSPKPPPKPKNTRIGRPPKGALSVREHVLQALQTEQWRTCKELCGIVNAQSRRITEELSRGVRVGAYARRRRRGMKYEKYEYKLVGVDDGV